MKKMAVYDVNQYRDNQIREDTKWAEFDFCIKYGESAFGVLTPPEHSKQGGRPHDERENTIHNITPSCPAELM